MLSTGDQLLSCVKLCHTWTDMFLAFYGAVNKFEVGLSPNDEFLDASIYIT